MLAKSIVPEKIESLSFLSSTEHPLRQRETMRELLLLAEYIFNRIFSMAQGLAPD